MAISTKKKFRGLEIEEIYCDGYLIWRIEIRNPFRYCDKWWFSLNDKLLEQARRQGIDKLLVKIGEKEISVNVPSKSDLRLKESKGEVEKIKSKFEGYPDWKRYLFPV